MRENDATWIQTYTGLAFWPNDPHKDDVDIHDIAHALANACRWTGHVRRHYSVAQHSVLVSYNVPSEDALVGLLHDASEAYISDIARPTKGQLSNYAEIEARLMRRIFAAYGLRYAALHRVKDADNILLITEARDLMRSPPMPWTYVLEVQPLKKKLRPWSPLWSEIRFLWRFGGLTGTRWPTMKRWLQLKIEDICS